MTDPNSELATDAETTPDAEGAEATESAEIKSTDVADVA